MTQETLVLGGGATGLEVASELAARGRSVTLVDEATTVGRARRAGVDAHESALDTAKRAVDRTAATVVVATGSDARNLLLAAAAPRSFDAERVVALVNDPRNRPAFDDAGVETVCVSRSVAGETVRAIAAEEPSGSTVASGAAEKVRLDD